MSDSGTESQAPSISLRLVVATIGALFCAGGVVLGSPWVIGAGIAALVATSLIPDKAIPLPRALASSATENSVPQWLMAGGITLVTASILGLLREVSSSWPLPIWLIGLGLVIASAIMSDVRADRWQLPPLRPLRSFDLGMLTALTVIGLILRIRRLETLPPMHGDEGEMGILALRVGSDEYLAPFTTGFFDHPTLFHYLQKLSMVVFGESVSGLRMNSAIAGALCIPLVYVAGRLGWSRRVGLVAAAVVAFSHVHIHFSRMALNNIHSVLMAVIMVAALLWANRALKERSHAITPLLLTGLACGLAQYFYYGSRLLPVVLAPGLLVLWWRYQSQNKRLALVPLGFLLAWLPLIPRYIEAPFTFASRQNTVSVFSETNRAAIDAESTWGVLSYQLQRNLRFFTEGGDVSTFYFAEAPGLSLLAAILFWVGLGLTLAKAVRFPNFMLLCWFVLGLVLGGVLTNGAPAATRLVIIYPAVALMGGIAADFFLGLVKMPDLRARQMTSGLLIGLAGLLCFSGVRIYFDQYAENPPRSAPDSIGRAFSSQSAATDTFLMGGPTLFARHGSILFTNHDNEPRDLENAAALVEHENLEPGLFVVGLPQNEGEMLALVDMVPGGEYNTVEDPKGDVAYFTYRVDH